MKKPEDYDDKELELDPVVSDTNTSNYAGILDELTYCLCDKPDHGRMILCDNDSCTIRWFHFSCVNLNRKPRGNWYCPNCRGISQTVMMPTQIPEELNDYTVKV